MAMPQSIKYSPEHIGISFHFPGQVAFWLRIAEHKRIRHNPLSIADNLNYYLFVWGIIESVMVDISGTLKVPAKEIVDVYESLLYLGSTPDRPFKISKKPWLVNEGPGLISLIPVEPERINLDAEGYFRELNVLFIERNGRTIQAKKISNSQWTMWRTRCEKELGTRHNAFMGVMMDQLKDDPILKRPGVLDGIDRMAGDAVKKEYVNKAEGGG